MIEPNTAAEGRAEHWVVVCESSALQEKRAIEVLVGTEVLALFRQNSQLHAIDGICAHQGGPIAKGSLDQKCITCPWHGWQYDISTGENLLTKRKMLRTFPIREANGVIEVLVDAG